MPSILRRSAAARLALPPAGPESFIAGGGRCAARSPHLPRLICQRHAQKGSARRRRRVNTGRGRVHAPNGPGRGSGRGGIWRLGVNRTRVDTWQLPGAGRGQPCGNGAGGGGTAGDVPGRSAPRRRGPAAATAAFCYSSRVCLCPAAASHGVGAPRHLRGWQRPPLPAGAGTDKGTPTRGGGERDVLWKGPYSITRQPRCAP